jgi:hypothetical protein
MPSTYYESVAAHREIARELASRANLMGSIKARLIKSPILPVPKERVFYCGPSERNHSTYTDEHIRMKPVMDVVRKSQDCKPISAGFAIQQEDKTIAEITWRWNHATEKIIGLNARLITKLSNHQRLLVNRTIIGIFAQAHMSMPEILYKHQSS